MSAVLQESLQQQTEELLWKLKRVCTPDEFSLLCWLCGYQSSYFKE